MARVAAHLEMARMRKEAAEQIRKTEERFQLCMEATNDGLWDWNVQTDEAYFSPACYRILGYSSDAFPRTGTGWKGLIHPDDFDRATQANMKCVEGAREQFEVEYRMGAATGEWRWILGRGKCIARDDSGRAVRMVGTHVDI